LAAARLSPAFAGRNVYGKARQKETADKDYSAA
jgi:hypothetical protein